ncbi:hypothetical protein CC86DRAFT_371232 [Ophiobolus disseminans]|uniref:DUF1772-domain-containing protein n=1 Tax=Ophiobolus disseminans TaxID=1469910 RepID=A0A6A6ZUD7_9PLEO|nr:hypothetical protein CC86DRAFT_371232 [Ophiobolus disseminans]
MAELYTQRTPTGLAVAQFIGITTSAYLLGQNASLSFISVPTIMLAPAPLAAKQWHKVLTIGGSLGIPLAMSSALAMAYVASQQDTSSTSFKLNLAAALLIPSIVPFTLLFIAPVNNKLIEKMNALKAASLEEKGVEEGVAQDETVHALIDKWATLNLARAGLIAGGVFCAVLAAVNKVGSRKFGKFGR